MGFADQINKHWNVGLEPVKEGVNDILKKAKEYEEQGKNKSKQKDLDFTK